LTFYNFSFWWWNFFFLYFLNYMCVFLYFNVNIRVFLCSSWSTIVDKLRACSTVTRHAVHKFSRNCFSCPAKTALGKKCNGCTDTRSLSLDFDIRRQKNVSQPIFNCLLDCWIAMASCVLNSILLSWSLSHLSFVKVNHLEVKVLCKLVSCEKVWRDSKRINDF